MVMTQRPRAFEDPIYVTRPMLPPLSEYMAELDAIWQAGWLTNAGEQHERLEEALSDYLHAPHLSLFNNGTIALLVACKALELTGEVITTPFTFPATPHALAWNNLTPVFADVDPESLTLDPQAVEASITPRTSAILAVHVYGMPCEVQALDDIARRHNLKVIYDGAHAFGTEISGQPIASFGDATMFSFHATKLFHSAEGGALAVRDQETKRQVDLLKNFGIRNEVDVLLTGINGKMNELQAALGFVNLRHIERERCRRAEVAAVYRARLANIPGLSFFTIPESVRHSMQYFVVRIDAEQAGVSRDDVATRARTFNLYTRRYFFPLCSEQAPYCTLPSAANESLPHAYQASREVLALPLYGDLGADGAHQVCDILEYVFQQG